MTKMKPLKQTTISTITFMMITKMATAFVYCPEGESCRPCSQCPENQIVRETCSGTRDTVCGPFTEFKLFPARGNAMLRAGIENNSDNLHGVRQDSDVDVDDSESWQTVTIVMVCVLSVTGVLFVVLVVITCHLCRRQNKESLLSQTDPERISDNQDQELTMPTTAHPTSQPMMAHPTSHTIDQFEIDVSAT